MRGSAGGGMQPRLWRGAPGRIQRGAAVGIRSFIIFLIGITIGSCSDLYPVTYIQ